MKLFLDTNVLLDHALIRETGQPYEAKFLISWAFDNKITLLFSQGSFYTFAYVLQKNGIKGNELRIKLRQYLTIVDIVNTDKDILLKGLDSTFTDIEDSFQYMTAVNEKCDYLITSNIADFKPHKIRQTVPITPLEFVSKILGKKKRIDF